MPEACSTPGLFSSTGQRILRPASVTLNWDSITWIQEPQLKQAFSLSFHKTETLLHHTRSRENLFRFCKADEKRRAGEAAWPSASLVCGDPVLLWDNLALLNGAGISHLLGRGFEKLRCSALSVVGRNGRFSAVWSVSSFCIHSRPRWGRRW